MTKLMACVPTLQGLIDIEINGLYFNRGLVHIAVYGLSSTQGVLIYLEFDGLCSNNLGIDQRPLGWNTKQKTQHRLNPARLEHKPSSSI